MRKTREPTIPPIPPESHESSTAEGSLPLSSNVVCLIGHSGGDVGGHAGDDEEEVELSTPLFE